MTKPILSITLLSSGRKETIWKCLDSLKPIMEAVSSELVIVDTGCDEETNQQMHEYTDLIFPFTWINDFAAARNFALDHCSGEWFMFIDDDEWFTDVTEIVEFFTSGEYRNYEYASYIQRNYNNMQGVSYSDYAVPRIYSLKNQPRFRSKIHEYIKSFGKCAHLNSPVDHYGYVFLSEEDRYRHYLRNVEPLEEIIREDPKDYHAYVQLLQEYNGMGKYAELLRTCQSLDKALVGMEKATGYQNVYSYNAGMEFQALLHLFREDEAMERFTKVYANRNMTDIGKAFLLMQRFYYYRDHKNDMAEALRKDGLAYLKFYTKLHQDKRYLAEHAILSLNSTFMTVKAHPMIAETILTALTLGDTDTFYQYIGELEWQGSLVLCVNFEKRLLEALISLPYDTRFTQTINETLMKSPAARKKVCDCLVSLQAEDSEKYGKACRIIAGVDHSDQPAIICAKLRYLYDVSMYEKQRKEGGAPAEDRAAADESSQIDALTEQEETVIGHLREEAAEGYRVLIEKLANFPELPVEIWKYAQSAKIDLQAQLVAIPYVRFMQAVNSYLATMQSRYNTAMQVLSNAAKQENGNPEGAPVSDTNADLPYRPAELVLDEAAWMVEWLCSCMPESDLRPKYLLTSYTRFVVRNSHEDASYEELQTGLQACVDRTELLYAPYYTEAALSGEMEMLPMDYRFAVRLKRLLDAEAAGDMKTFTAGIEETADTMPNMKETVLHYAKMVAEMQKAQAGATDAAVQDQMAQLRAQIIQKADALRAAGMTAEADQILAQLEKFS